MKPRTEESMRETKVPTCKTDAELLAYIKELVEGQHDYGTCVYAMSMAATAAFSHVAHRLQVTGFQASCADLDILRRTRLMDCPFTIVKLEDAMYPQYNIEEKVKEFIEQSREWLRDQARKRLVDSPNACAEVRKHWHALASVDTGK